jgi:tRNA 5-methylaminomethyl-2-thiouridine biosynthesis bifunctional protein
MGRPFLLSAAMTDLDWTDAGPRSTRFGDVYFSAQDGLAESRSVFLEGCGLPEAWAGRAQFTVGELGFGTGLNIAALLELWRRTRPPGGRLNIFSIEAYPIRREEAARALSPWPELAAVTAPMLARWPGRTPGFHRLELPQLDVVIDLAVAEAGAALADWSGRADAWFLDGFSPAVNPKMWRDEVLALVAARSNPGARASTFTVAGAVRRGLAATGFQVEKRPGFGRKRERLEARLGGTAGDPARPASVGVIGAGIAGAALARALREVGLSPVLFEAQEPGAGASGNAAALVTPRLDAGGGAVARLSAQAFRRAAALYGDTAPEAVLARGVLQLEGQARDASRFDRIALQDLWDAGAMARLDAAAAGERLGEPCAVGGLWMGDALVVEPMGVLAAWLADSPVRVAAVARIAPSDGGWRLFGRAGEVLAEVEVLVLAGGAGVAALASEARLAPVRGQATTARGASTAPAAWGGYALPTREGLLFGATHDRGDEGAEVRTEDSARNLETLGRVRPVLAAALAGGALEGRAGVRAVTPDRLPLCGALAPGLFVLGGLGSRGFSFAPLLAEHLAAEIAGAPSPLPRGLATLVEPRRSSILAI